jgi:serine protease Do
LINLRGELIGINNAVYRQENAQGISFAIPIKLVGEAISKIFTPENKGFWFGAHVRSDENQLLVDSVQVGSPADKAGLTPGDTILKMGDKAPKNFISFMVELIKQSENQSVPLAILHDGKQRMVTVKIVKEEAVFNADLIRQKLGVTVEALTPQITQYLGVQLGSGLVISGVDKNSPAANADLSPGIILTGLDDEQLGDVKTVAKKLYEKRKGDSVTLNLFAVKQQGGFLFPRAGRVTLKVR